ncbi:MAG: hypothetical protein QM500_16105 [Methylococcales bacterium]
MNENINKQKNHLLMKVVSLLIVMLLAGCSSIQVGRDFDTQNFESIAKVGKTTKAQVLDKMGSPKSKGVSLNREAERLQEWVYFYATGKLIGMDDAQLKILQIRFDKNGIMRSYNWSNSNK